MPWQQTPKTLWKNPNFKTKNQTIQKKKEDEKAFSGLAFALEGVIKEVRGFDTTLFVDNRTLEMYEEINFT